MAGLPASVVEAALSAAKQALRDLYGDGKPNGVPDAVPDAPLAVSTRNALPENVKQFIVIHNAHRRSPRDVVHEVKETFNLTISAAVVERYDPTKVNGQTMRDELKRLYFQAQRDHEAILRRIGITNQDYRLACLHVMQVATQEMGAYKLSAKLLEQAAKEVGGFYSKAPRAVKGVDDQLALLAGLLNCRPEDLPPIPAAGPAAFRPQPTKEKGH
ncbi:MAG: DUF2280 domain-containing protein [Armatimonadetes bacterium]|nr:DUF2280 domain-containing protein [Armatimonadota bacterium]